MCPADGLCWLFLILLTVAPVILHSVCYFQSSLSSLFLLLLLMHIVLPPLHLKFSLTAAERWHTLNQMHVQLCVSTCVRSELSDSVRGKRVNVISCCTLWYCPCADRDIDLSLFRLELIIWVH